MGSILARGEILVSQPEWRFNYWNPDIILCLSCAHHGNLGYLPEFMSVYRRHSGSLTASLRASREKRFSDAISQYQNFDKETHYQHTDIIRAKVRQVKADLQRERWGWFYFWLHPLKFAAKLKEYFITRRDKNGPACG